MLNRSIARFASLFCLSGFSKSKKLSSMCMSSEAAWRGDFCAKPGCFSSSISAAYFLVFRHSFCLCRVPVSLLWSVTGFWNVNSASDVVFLRFGSGPKNSFSNGLSTAWLGIPFSLWLDQGLSHVWQPITSRGLVWTKASTFRGGYSNVGGEALP